MRHGYFGKKLSRNTNERRRLFVGLTRELIAHGKIVTTITKAKAIRPLVEKLITRAKKGGDQARRIVFKTVADKALTQRLLDDAKNRFSRSSGFTRMVKLGRRSGDDTEEVLLSFVDVAVVAPVVSESKSEKPKELMVKNKVTKVTRSSKVKKSKK